ALVTSMMVTQTRVPAPAPQLTDAPISLHTSVMPASASQYTMPEGCPWGMPDHFLSEGFRPLVSEIPMPSVQQGLSSPQVTV
ncbi:hypothetical protein A2U01_0091196, partial [Trifolium medium]|nr:hypothetical protein [Trifolium medium]